MNIKNYLLITHQSHFSRPDSIHMTLFKILEYAVDSQTKAHKSHTQAHNTYGRAYLHR